VNDQRVILGLLRKEALAALPSSRLAQLLLAKHP